MSSDPLFAAARRRFHIKLEESGLLRTTGTLDKRSEKSNPEIRSKAKLVPSNADGDSPPSVDIAVLLLRKLGIKATGSRLKGQTIGTRFEQACTAFLVETFLELQHLRPGAWHVERLSGERARLGIANYDQYAHLAALQKLAENSEEMRVALGRDYLIKPDVVIWREPEDDGTINESRVLVDEGQSRLTSLRERNSSYPILHASVSCKMTIRSDRAQNTRSEALNLVRNRKGRLPHVVAITSEPLPGRIASLALGTGDIDCIYHVALRELMEAVEESGRDDSAETLRDMVSGKRLRDITDLPLDLVV